jgi:two-component system, NtrC family, sensor histidine kinase HydH
MIPPLRLHSLRAKLMLFSLALVVVPGIVFGLIAFASAQRALENAVGRQLAEVAHDTAAEVTELIDREGRNMHSWARQEVMRELVIGDIDKHISRLLTSLKESDIGYLDLLCTDASGRVVAASNPALLSNSQADYDWHRAVTAGDQFYVGSAVIRDHGHVALELGTPIYNPDKPGTMIGALLGWYDWERSTALAERIQQNSTLLGIVVDVLILDDSGTVIAQAGGHRFPQLLGQDLRRSGWAAAAEALPRLRPAYVREPRAAALVGYARLQEPNAAWTAVVVQPLVEALAPVYRMRRRLAVMLAAVLFSALGVALLLAERMVRPLRALTRATKDIARGQAQRPVRVSTRDEIGDLAQAFNSMASQLTRAQDDLITAAKFAFVGEVAAGIAHEVRTPLGILRSSAQILGRSLPASCPDGVELVEMIVSEVDRLDRVVAGLLELARPREPHIEPTSLSTVLSRALDFADGQARGHGIVVRRALDAPQRAARCDPEQIYQVALNLIVNALQILPSGGVLTVRTVPGHDGAVGFEVSDTGPGIPPEACARIFTPFFTMRKGGTGLGLALVQRVVQAHQGTVVVNSVLGRGTTFRVELPSVEDKR